jgi:hypothetical protein
MTEETDEKETFTINVDTLCDQVAALSDDELEALVKREREKHAKSSKKRNAALA